MADEFNPNPSLGDRLEALEGDLKDFARDLRKKLQAKLALMGLKNRAKLARSQSKIRYNVRQKKGQAARTVSVRKEEFLYKSLGSRVKKKGGDIDGIAVSFARHGIFLELGVGKGRPVGSSMAKKAARPWLNNILDQATTDLADLLAEKYADIVAAEVVIKIPGVIDTSIK